MTREQQLKFCRICQRRLTNLNSGLICSLTGERANFDGSCPNFLQDDNEWVKELDREIFMAKVNKGKKKAISLVYVLISLSLTIMFLTFLANEAYTGRLVVQEVVRLILSLGLYYAIYIGKSWARILTTILLFIGFLIMLFSLLAMFSDAPFVSVLLIPIIIYAYSIYFLIADKDFITFFEYQKKNA